MKNYRSFLIFLSLSVCSQKVWADTLTLRSNTEINGRVRFEKDTFSITAEYNSGEKTFKLDRREVKSLEINPREFNAGEPPLNVSVFDAFITKRKDASASGSPANDSAPVHETPTKQDDPSNKSIFASSTSDAGTSDIIWLKDKTKVLGRMTLIQKGYITLRIGKQDKQIDEKKTAGSNGRCNTLQRIDSIILPRENRST